MTTRWPGLPGSARLVPYRLPQGIAMGTYRLFTDAGAGRATKPERVLTPPFRVARSTLPQ
jgi:hypothetical protein